MKINFDQTLKKLDGSVITDEDKKEVTLAMVTSACLLNVYEGEKKPGAEIQAYRYDLALKVYKGGEQDFSMKDLSTMQGRVEKHPNMLISEQSKRMLEPKE